MKRSLSFIVLCAIFVIVGIGSHGRISAASVNDFVVTDYQIDYYLARDGDYRSTLKTVEVFTADFPITDQNHGIERALPQSYDGHSTGLSIQSITDENGKHRPYSTYGSNKNLVVRIGDKDSYVHGKQTYKITYQQLDTTRYFADSGRDEFYWDTNGTEWAVPITSLSARLHLSNDVAKRLTNNQSCYQGVAGSNKRCQISRTDDGYTLSVNNLQPYENVTLAIGFQPQTFASYKMPLSQILLLALAILMTLTFVIAIIVTIWLSVDYYKRSNRSREINTIVTEYLPPKDTSVSTAATISQKPLSAFSAQLIDFAVRHYIKIYQTREKSTWKSAEYELEIIRDISDLKTEEQELFRDLFDNPIVGARLDMKSLKNNTAMATKIRDNPGKLDVNIKGEYSLRAPVDEQSAIFRKRAKIVLVVGILTLSPWLLITSLTAYFMAKSLKPLTDKGLDLARYLKGLEQYIKVAETDRIKMLQSPEGAAKLDAPIDTNDKRQLIKLYERVLPYAILFGQEKDWNKQLGQYYSSVNESPSWYNSNSGVFNAVLFSSAMSNFNTSANYSSASSSSSSGSGGGGSSGGGGGGGGGGGW